MIKKLVLASLMIQLAWATACGRHTSEASLQSSPQVSENVIFADGASNTAGFAATFPFGERLRYHFKSNGFDMASLLHGKKIFFSLDYFFPTNFPEYTDNAVAPEKLYEIVTKKLDSLASKYDYLLLLDLFDKETMEPSYQALLNPGDHPQLNTIFSELTRDARAKAALHSVNEAMNDYAAKHPQVIIVKSVLIANYMAVNKSYQGYYPKHLFGDPIHLNDAGQAAIFNIAFIPALSRVPELKYSKVSNMPLSYDDGWKDAVIKLISLGKESFVSLTSGEYWGEIQNFGTWSNPFTKPVFQKGGDLASAERVSILDSVRSKISWASMAAPANHFVLLEKGKEGTYSLGFDLRKVLFFTTIKLHQPNPSLLQFVGYGYDHWTSVSGDPSTNYKFVASVDSQDRTLIHVTWTVYPLLERTENGQVIHQEKRPVREGFLAAPWIDEIEKNGSAYPTLTFSYDVRID